MFSRYVRLLPDTVLVDGLAHAVDPGPHAEEAAASVEQAHLQEGSGHVAETEGPQLNEHQHEDSTEGSEHGKLAICLTLKYLCPRILFCSQPLGRVP